jgi:hypothetical protein
LAVSGKRSRDISEAIRILESGFRSPSYQPMGRVTLRQGAVWYEEPVPNYPKWIAAYRLMAHPVDGRPIVAEVRVFPYEERRPGRGFWSGSLPGVPTKSPASGIDPRVLRKVSTVRPLRQTAAEMYASRKRGTESTTPAEWGAVFDQVLSDAGFSPTGILKRPGRAGRRDEDYLPFVELYVKACEEGRRDAVKYVAAQMFGRTEDKWVHAVRDALKEARTPERGLLSPPPVTGRAGGQLTKKARDLLAKRSAGRRKR